MTIDEEHANELLRFVSVANQEVTQGRLDAWHMIHTVDTEHPGYMKLEVRGLKGQHSFAFHPPCTCDLAERFVHATALLNRKLGTVGSHTEGAKVTRLRRDDKTSH